MSIHSIASKACVALCILVGLLCAPILPAQAQSIETLTEHKPDEAALADLFAYLDQVDCAISTDTGYSSGQPFPIDVVHIGDKAVEKDTANAFLVMQEAASADGVNIGIVSGFRTYAEQEYLYGCYVNCNCNNCNLAALPGYSNHNSGHALDLNTSAPGVYAWLAAHGDAFGFSRTVPSEDWHWEWWGGGPGGGVCGFEDLDCLSVPAEGRVIEDGDDCFVAGGDSRYWRHVDEGHGGTLLWTKTTANADPANYALWNLKFEQAGSYELFVYTDAGAYGQSVQAGYLVTHSGSTSKVELDQGGSEGWRSLGSFDFDTGDEQSLRLNDNTGEAWADDPGGVRLMVDALKIEASQSEGDDDDDNDNDRSRPTDESDLAGACSSSSGSQGSMPTALFCLLLLVYVRKWSARQMKR